MDSYFWKSIEETTFRAREDGDWDFYPYGVLKSGYRINAAQRENIDAALQGFYGFVAVAIGAGVLLGIFGGAFGGESPWNVLVWVALIAVGVTAALLGYWCIRLRPLWRDLPRSERRLGFGETQAVMARTMPKWRIVLLLIVGQLFGMSSVFLLWIAFRDGEARLRTIGTFGLLFAAAAMWLGIIMWRKRRAFERTGG